MNKTYLYTTTFKPEKPPLFSFLLAIFTGHVPYLATRLPCGGLLAGSPQYLQWSRVKCCIITINPWVNAKY